LLHTLSEPFDHLAIEGSASGTESSCPVPEWSLVSRFTELLDAAGGGDRQAAADLFSLVYDDLRQLAGLHLVHERPGQTLQPTALVHEVYLRLLGGPSARSDQDEMPWKNRRHFFAAAAEAMRRILIESARRKKRQKHGGDHKRVPLEPDQIAAPELADDLLALDEALTALAAVEPTIAELVTLRYFGGLTLKEVAQTLEIAPRTADAHWAYARAWLLAEMTRSDKAWN
jgi:RNA polymerase sigma factor (TIGR02999 family)